MKLVFVTLCLMLATTAIASEVPTDVPILPGSKPMEEVGRYQSARSYDETIDYYERVFKNTAGGVRWRSVVNIPGVKAKHVECLKKKTNWEGINIYELNGEVRFYVIPRDKGKNKAKVS